MHPIHLTPFGAGLLLLAGSVLADPNFDQQNIQRISRFLEHGVVEGFAGAVLIARGDEILLNSGFGWANKDQKIPNTPDTVFDIGSNTKQFTGAAIISLVDSGQLSIDQTLDRFFPEVPQDKAAITIHQLLTHSAGFTESIGSDFETPTRETFFDQLFATDLEFQPGEKYGYSNVGYSVLARIVELVSKKDFEAFLHEALFEPAGLQRTGYLRPDWSQAALARGYPMNVIDEGPMVERYRGDGAVSWHLLGNGGINTTQNELFRWIRALKHRTLLSESAFEELTTGYVEGGGGRFSYGYGWGVSTTDGGGKRLSHNGSNGRFAHSIIWHLDADVTILFATNTDSPELERVAYEVERMLNDSSYQPTPIRKNPYFLVVDFANKNPVSQIQNLWAQIGTAYPDALSERAFLNRIGNLLLSEEKSGWATALFEKNVGLFPDDGNLHDSLGEAHYVAGRLELAQASFERALALAPNPDCSWCGNARRRIEAMTEIAVP